MQVNVEAGARCINMGILSTNRKLQSSRPGGSMVSQQSENSYLRRTISEISRLLQYINWVFFVILLRKITLCTLYNSEWPNLRCKNLWSDTCSIWTENCICNTEYIATKMTIKCVCTNEINRLSQHFQLFGFTHMQETFKEKEKLTLTSQNESLARSYVQVKIVILHKIMHI